MTVLMQDLKRMPEKEFAEHLLIVLQSWLDKGKSKLDPKEFRTLYINKIYSNQDYQGRKGSSRQISIQVVSNSSISFSSNSPGTPGKNPSFIQSLRDQYSGGGSEGTSISLLPQDLLQFEEKDELALTNDLIGLTFYQVSDQYKRKFLTLHQHF